MESSEAGIIIVGNAGSGKSYICNLLIGYDRFKADFQPEAVTTQTEHHQITVGSNFFQVYNISGLAEVNQESIDRNKREIMKVFNQSLISLVIFVWTQIGGRAQSDDVIAFNALNNAYKFPSGSLMFVVNNIPVKRPPEYEGKFLATLANLLKPMEVSTQDTFFIDALKSEENEKIMETCSRLYLFIEKHHAALQPKDADIVLQSDQLKEMREALKRQQLEAEKDRKAFQDQLTQTTETYAREKKEANRRYGELMKRVQVAEKNAREWQEALQQAEVDREEDEEEHEKLPCEGYACSTCKRCKDWHRVDSHWALVDGGKCNAARYLIYLHYPVLCRCKKYYGRD